ncbi:MAG: alpha/beta fold hydrolase [Leptolyngbyaceae cyanobacterium]
MDVPMRLQVRCQGEGLRLLCLHGHPGNSQALSVFTDRLSQRFRTLTPDLRGYGQSRTHHPFEMSDHLKDLEALIAAETDSPYWILGWSLGGILALELALRQPNQVAGLILVATAARPRGNHPPISWQDNLYTVLASVINRLVPGWGWNIDVLGRRSLYRHLIQQHSADAYRRLAAEGWPAYFQTSKFATQALNQALRQGYNRLPDLAQVTQPALVLCGECDRHITAASSQETAAHLPNSTLKTYPQVAHLFPWEIPDQVLTDIDSWLKTVAASRSQHQK